MPVEKEETAVMHNHTARKSRLQVPVGGTCRRLCKGVWRCLSINISIECVLLDELSAGAYIIAHEHGEYVVGIGCIL